MRGLLLFLTNNSSTFLFFVLEAVCFYVIVRFNDNQERVWQSTSTAVIGSFNKKADDIHYFFSLSRQMDRLQEENKNLRQEIQRMARMQGDSLLEDTIVSGDFHQPFKYTNDKDSMRADFTFIPVGVVDNSITAFDNTLILDRGSLDGVEPNMGVINADGIVGIVRQVSEHYSTVMSLLHRQTRVSAAIKGKGAFGVLRWYPPDTRRMQLEDVPQHEIVERGDSVFTTGYPLSNIFPKGIFIGTVEKAYIKEGENFYTIDVKLHINLSQAHRAYVVSLNHQKELLDLKQQILR